MHRLTWIFLVFGILQLCAAQPLYGFEKALLYSFEDPESIEWVPKVRRKSCPRRAQEQLIASVYAIVLANWRTLWLNPPFLLKNIY